MKARPNGAQARAALRHRHRAQRPRCLQPRKSHSAAMQVVPFSDLEALAPHASHWDRLAMGNPFRSWVWSSTWWRHYGAAGNPKARLCVLGVRNEQGRWIGLAPWYIERSALWGRLLKFLGSGEVCSEYLGLLAEAGQEEAVADAVADWLVAAREPADRWDMAEWRSVDAEDAATRLLVEVLRRRKLAVHCRPGPSCWRIALPATWSDFLGTLSPSRRKKIARAENLFLNSGRTRVHVTHTAEDLAVAQEVLIELHRRRRESLGERGCFHSSRCASFHREVMRHLLAQDRLLLYWLSLDGRPVAAEYTMRGGGVLYAYQAGMDPESLALSPGHLSLMIGIRHAISEGYWAFDFLRGDEPYKSHWRASPRPVLEFRVAAPRPLGRLRLVAWRAGSQVKRRFKALLRPGGETPFAAAEPVPTAVTTVQAEPSRTPPAATLWQPNDADWQPIRDQCSEEEAVLQ